ncbi:PspA/IM30 family protein [Mesobacillus foraminis]|uniref:PspA/IM30 family protein n=1 Tax=Mesobacillus foraminis TaxID=279826 RepID=UPI000EF4CCD9|nr:PspA/IM30 family protein [Mesobacillus foraminis]
MSIFKRIRDIATADFHEALDRLEDPVSMLKQHMRELEQQLRKAHGALANQLYIEKKYQSIINETRNLVEKRSRQAELAVEKENDDIARLALEDKLVNEAKLNACREQYQQIKSQTDLLCGQIDKLRAAYEELQTRKLVLISRLNVAKATADIGKAAASFNPEFTVQGLNKAEDQALRLEAKAEASQYGLVKSNSIDHVHLNDQVEAELSKMKERKSVTV